MKTLVIENDVIINNIKRERETEKHGPGKQEKVSQRHSFEDILHGGRSTVDVITGKLILSPSYATNSLYESTLGFLLCKTNRLGISKGASSS